MATSHVTQIMRSKGAPFTDDLLARMNDHECWQWIYANKNVRRPRPPRLVSRAICFTGFVTAKKHGLMESAAAAGYRVLQAPGVSMTHLCVGETPGWSKLETARKQGAIIVTENEFLNSLQDH